MAPFRLNMGRKTFAQGLVNQLETIMLLSVAFKSIQKLTLLSPRCTCMYNMGSGSVGAVMLSCGGC